MQEDDSSTVEEGFSVTEKDNWDRCLDSNNRKTELTDAEFSREGWFLTDEDMIDRATDDFGAQAAIVEGMKYLLNLVERQARTIHRLEKRARRK